MALFNVLGRKDQASNNGKSPLLEVMKQKAGVVKNIPTLPEAALKALTVAKDPNCALPALATIIEKDLALTAGILRLANSPLYRIGRAVEQLDRALLRLGLRETQNLILTVSMHSLFRQGTPPQRAACEKLWRHALVTAALCRLLNRGWDLGFAGEEFACGISHDLGRCLMALIAFDSFQQADPLDFEEGPETLAREQEVLGTDHCYFGAWFASMNQLPGSLISTIQYHHLPSEAGEHRVLVSLVATADHMANHLQRGLPVSAYAPVENPGPAHLGLDLLESQKLWFAENAHALMEDVTREVTATMAA